MNKQVFKNKNTEYGENKVFSDHTLKSRGK